MAHRQLALQHDVADSPPPAWQSVIEVKGLEGRCAPVGATAPPAHSCTPSRTETPELDSSTGFSATQTEATSRRPTHRGHQQPVIAPSAQPADGTHRVTIAAVGNQPFPITTLGK